MKTGTIIINTFLATFLAISQNLFFPTGLNQAKAQGSPKPYIVFVNGQGNCCAWGMNDLQNRLTSYYGLTRNDFRYVPYSNFGDGGRSGGGNQYDWTSVDSRFLKDAENFMNNVLDRNRPLILIGHSYGGDSILKLLPRLNRRIQFVAVIDPVARGGLRHPINGYTVPGNVDYFFNRWQENEPWPIDFKVSGSVLCNARQCDQKSQFAHTSVDGKPNRESCKWYETCNNKQVRTGHQSLPSDDFIEKVIGERIEQQIPKRLTALTPFDQQAYDEGVRKSSLRLAAVSGTGFTICNKTTKALKFAVGHFDADNPRNPRDIIRGWFNVDPDRCRRPISSSFFSNLPLDTDIYIHFAGDYSLPSNASAVTRLCVDRSRDFAWNADTKCSSSDRVTFSIISRRERPGLTINVQ